MSEGTYNRAPIRVIELEQPRCNLRFGQATVAGLGTPDFTLSDGDTISSAALDRSLPVVADIDVTFASSPSGIIWEQGGASVGSYLGVTSGELVWRAGNGSSGGTSETAMIRTSATPFNGKSLRIVIEAVPSDGSVRMTVYEGTTIIFQRSVASSDGAFPRGTWTGSNDGAIGTLNGAAVGGEDLTDWNGSIASAEIYNDTTITFSGCTATGTPKCYQTFWTCKDTANYTPDGFIRWRFYDGRNGNPFLYEQFDNVNEIGTNAFPALRSGSTLPSRINVGGQSENESPFGTRSKLTVEFDEFEFDDHVGDFYTADRTLKTAGFWAKFMARNPYYPNMIIRDYQGYEGQALSAMQVREYVLDNIEQTSPTRVRVTARDPLDLASDKKAQFPRPSDIQLLRTITATKTEIEVRCPVNCQAADFGNTGDERYVRFGSEIVRYTGWTGSGPDYTLTGVQRGVLGTVADRHEEGDSGQRVGRYENIRMYRVARDLLENHTTIPSRFYDFAQWEEEGGTFLPMLQTDATISDPTAVEQLSAELSRDGLFNIWWDERNRVIPIRVVRPPIGTPDVWSDELQVLQGSFDERAETDDFLTRVAIFYNRKDPTLGLEDEPNYRVQSLRIDADLETDDATGEAVRERKIFSRWINTAGNALLVSAQIMLQYRFIPRYLTINLDAKDRSAEIGQVIDLDTRHKVDIEGNRLVARYQVISIDESEPGHSLEVELQSFQFVGKFAIIMANDAPSYADATEAERESGCWFADETTGLMPDGTEPYLLQ